MAVGYVQYCHECVHELHRAERVPMFLVPCGLISLTGVLCSPATVFQEPKSQNFCRANPVGWSTARAGVAEVRRYSCVAALQLGGKVAFSDCLNIAFSSKPGHSYQWGGRFGMCNCALYLKSKEKTREKCHLHDNQWEFCHKLEHGQDESVCSGPSHIWDSYFPSR